MKKRLTFRESQLKYNALYIKQPAPKELKIFKGSLALLYSIEVLLLQGHRP